MDVLLAFVVCTSRTTYIMTSVGSEHGQCLITPTELVITLPEQYWSYLYKIVVLLYKGYVLDDVVIYLQDYPHYNPNQEAQLRQLAENHGRQMEYLQIKNKDLEKQREGTFLSLLNILPFHSLLSFSVQHYDSSPERKTISNSYMPRLVWFYGV